MTFVGEKEFEDAFADSLIVTALNADYPRKDNETWVTSHLQDARSSEKFSEALYKTVLYGTKEEYRRDARKPALCRSIANHCQSQDIPEEVRAALEAVHALATGEETSPAQLTLPTVS